MNTYSLNLIKAKKHIGSWGDVADVLNVTPRAIFKWRKQGFPPRTEYSKETNYAQLLEEATGGKVKESELRPDLSPRT